MCIFARYRHHLGRRHKVPLSLSLGDSSVLRCKVGLLRIWGWFRLRTGVWLLDNRYVTNLDPIKCPINPCEYSRVPRSRESKKPVFVRLYIDDTIPCCVHDIRIVKNIILPYLPPICLLKTNVETQSEIVSLGTNDKRTTILLIARSHLAQDPSKMLQDQKVLKKLYDTTSPFPKSLDTQTS